MNVSLYQAAAALNANSRWQEVISENLAASSIPGFKKQGLSFSAVQAGLITQPGAGPQSAVSHFALPTAATSTNFSPGELRFTGVKTDTAIEGPGFFEVEMPSGNRGYTRDGEFQLNANGQLVTKEGYLVMGDSGAIQFDRNNPAPIAISANGEVSQGGDIRGKIKVVDFSQKEKLTPVSSGYFVVNDPTLKMTELPDANVRQGFLEGPNASPTIEMANLISVMRASEANQRIIQMQDERMGKAISELGNPTA